MHECICACDLYCMLQEHATHSACNIVNSETSTLQAMLHRHSILRNLQVCTYKYMYPFELPDKVHAFTHTKSHQ